LYKSTKPGLYSLEITTSVDGDEVTETFARSVWVMKSAPGRVTFAHLADTHTGDPRAAMSPSVEQPDERREKVLRAACASGVDFVIVTGDIVSVPGNYPKEYKEAFSQFEQFVSCPLFLVPGNHDQYTTHASKKSADGAAFWQRYFGEDKYAFSIGQYAFVAVNTYDWPAQYRNFMNQPLMRQVGSYSSGAMSRGQYIWLDQTLAGLSDKHTLVFGHHLFRDFSTKNSSVPDLEAPDHVLGLLASHGVKYYFAGHNHRNTGETVQGVTLSTVVSAASDIPDDASWGFRKCTAENESVSCEFISVVPRTD
jgi:3',5'-cyclic AMP phosphodiesterase CpdA